MEKAIDTRTKLLTKNPFSLMLELSIPAILGMVVVGLYNMMDSIFIGQMVGAAQMGAVSVSYPFTLINAGSDKGFCNCCDSIIFDILHSGGTVPGQSIVHVYYNTGRSSFGCYKFPYYVQYICFAGKFHDRCDTVPVSG